MNEIGEILKKARIERGYTLDDLQQTTKIQKRYLEAIEKGNTEILPGGFYARAFVKQYADIVGLDGEELLDEYFEVTTEEVNEEIAESMSASPSRAQGEKEGFLGRISEHLPTILIFIVVALILVVIYFAFRQTTSSDQANTPIISEENTEELVKPEAEESDEEEKDTDTEEEEEEEEEEEQKEQEVKISTSTGSATDYEITGPHPEEQEIVLTADGGDSWVSIQVQGGASDSGLLSDGQSMSVDFGSDVETIDIVVGNASFTTVLLNDTDLQYSPESEGIVKQDLTLRFVD